MVGDGLNFTLGSQGEKLKRGRSVGGRMAATECPGAIAILEAQLVVAATGCAIYGRAPQCQMVRIHQAVRYCACWLAAASRIARTASVGQRCSVE
jgi:hypothetical protein